MAGEFDPELAQILVDESLERLNKDQPVEFYLVLNTTLMGKEGVHQLLDALILHPNVYPAVLYSMEGGGDEEGLKLTAALKASTTMKRLIIAGNKFSNVTAAALIEALGTNTSLTHLNIKGSFTPDAEKEIQRRLTFILQTRELDVNRPQNTQ
jgi:hypothetical protein